MKRLLALGLLLIAPVLAPAAEPAADEAIFVEGSLYSAVLHTGRQAWRLLPADGPSLVLKVRPACQAGLPPPRGLWLLTRDAEGRPALVAPSSTDLPPGHPGQVPLVACGEPLPEGTPALAVPADIIAWLGQHSGAIYVAR